MDRYQRIEKIGEGTYGVVYKAQDAQGNICALKKIRLETEDGGIPSTAVREIALLKQLRHPNVVKLYDVLHTEKRLTLVFEFVDSDLKKLLDASDGGLDPKTTKLYLKQLLGGLAHCHEHQILHRDLKPQNLLINRQGQLRIADFGLARACGIPVRAFTHEVVTLWYRPPDVLLGSRRYDTDLDMWSVGCIFGEMAQGKPLFPGVTETDQVQKIFEVLGKPDPKTWPDADKLPRWQSFLSQFQLKTPAPQSLDHLKRRIGKSGVDLLEKMLVYNPSRRISAHEAMQHEYFRED